MAEFKDILLRNVVFEVAFDPGPFRGLNGYEFLAAPDKDTRCVQLMGFMGDVLFGQGSTEDRIVPVTEFDLLPKNMKTVEAQGKGVGPRLYNTEEGPFSLLHMPTEVGVFVCTIGRERLLDVRVQQGSARQQIQRQLGKKVARVAKGTSGVVSGVHREYDGRMPDLQAVLLNTPPQALHRLRNRKKLPPGDIDSKFVLIRDPSVLIRRVGSVLLDQPEIS